MAGKFIVFEGLTGSGKKSHINTIADRLRAAGQSVTVISFPNFETDIVKLTKRNQFDPYTLALLYAADRSQYQERIKGLLEKGGIVISDRYCYSNFAYQSAQGISIDWLQSIEKNIIKPDLVFFIDIPIEMGIKRVQQANIEDFTKKEILDRLEREKQTTERVRETYLFIARTDKESKWYVIDGRKNISETIEEVWNIVKQKVI